MPRPIQTDFLFTSQLETLPIPNKITPLTLIRPKHSFKTNNSMDLEEMKNDALYVFSRLIGKVESELKRLKKKECEVSEYEALIQEIQTDLLFIENHLMN